MVQGNNIIISREVGSAWVPFAASKSNTIDVESQTIEISSVTTGQWRDFIPGRKEWSITLNFLVIDGDHAIDSLLSVGQRILSTIITDRQQGKRIDGYAIIKNCKVTATRGNLVQGSFSFVGCGQLYDRR